MNFKIENRVLNITNYPSVERHLEDMASKGWLIDKIILGSAFVYKKIKPEKLEFSISPYEVETAFTRKSKEELEEFRSVCESVGWNYATKAYDFHIYFKEKGSDALAIETDEDEEFKTLENIATKWNTSLYIQIIVYLFLSWFMIGNVLNNIHSMKSGILQIATILIPFMTILAIKRTVSINRFIKKNRENIKLGKNIEYSSSKFYFTRFVNILTSIFVLISVVYLLYVGLILKNYLIIMSIAPGLIGVSLGYIYRLYVKPSRKTKKYKKKLYVLFIFISGIMSAVVGLNATNDKFDIEEYRVLSFNDFNEDDLENQGDLRRDMSFLIPESYEYLSYNENEDKFIITEYSNVLTESLAKNLVERYKKQGVIRATGRYSGELSYFLEQESYNDELLEGGITEEEFSKLKTMDIVSATEILQEMIEDKSIVEDKNEFWNADGAYFLNYEKTEMVLRKGKEVFYLEGKDFSDPEIRNITKNRLKL